MKKIHMITLIISVVLTILGILLFADYSKIIVGICFGLAALGYFSNIVLAIFIQRKNKV